MRNADVSGTYHGSTDQDEFDPWAAAAAARNLPNRTGDATAARLAAIEANVDQKIQEKVQEAITDQMADGDEPMMPMVEPRMARLEQQMAQLQETQNVFQKNAVQLEQKVDRIQVQVESQSQAFSQTLDTKLQEQMDRVEALIHKQRRVGE